MLVIPVLQKVLGNDALPVDLVLGCVDRLAVADKNTFAWAGGRTDSPLKGLTMPTDARDFAFRQDPELRNHLRKMAAPAV